MAAPGKAAPRPFFSRRRTFPLRLPSGCGMIASEPRATETIRKWQEEFSMKHKVRVTVLKKNLYPELQQAYCADPHAGAVPLLSRRGCFRVLPRRQRDDFWHMGVNTLVRTKGTQTLWRAAPSCRSSQRPGTPSPGTFTRGLAGRLHHAGVDEGGKHHDRLLL